MQRSYLASVLDIFAFRGAFISKPKPSQTGSISNSFRLRSHHSRRRHPTKLRRSRRSLCCSRGSLCSHRRHSLRNRGRGSLRRRHVATAAAVAASTTAAASAVAGTYERGCSGVLFVEDIERRQADVRDFLLTESDFVFAVFCVGYPPRLPRVRRSPATTTTRRLPTTARRKLDLPL